NHSPTRTLCVPRLREATTKAMPVSIVLGAKRRVMKQSGDLRGPDRARARARVGDRAPARRRHLDRGTAPVALTAARPEGWRACVSPLMRAHVSGPPADVVVFMNTGTKVAQVSDLNQFAPWHFDRPALTQG